MATDEEQIIVEDTVALLEGRSPAAADFRYSFEKGGASVTPANDVSTIPVAVSNRHLHISRKDLDSLFGPGYQLKPMRPLSQPGQYACEECVAIVGPKGKIENVRILGPERKATQVEVSQTDAYKLGIQAPVRDSGDVASSAKLTLVGPKGEVPAQEGTIISWRHVHMHTKDAARFGVKDKERVRVRTTGERSVTFENVLIRVSDSFALEMHIDTDEANAALLRNGDTAVLIKG
ncbi:MAG: phosphate propanoyltransferase [Oligoflexia bacterium]|nr:phosphate propanoyltransferase [Oligoflexia bacterium]